MISRSDLSELVPLDSSTPARSFVLEVHAEDPITYLRDIADGGSVEETGDAFLSHVSIQPDGEFWVDRLDPRFWVFHTTMPSVDAVAWLGEAVESRRDTDWIWLPSAHLRNIAPGALSRRVRTEFNGNRLVSADDIAHDLKVQLTGTNAEQLLDMIADLPGYKSAVSFSNIEVAIDDPDLGSLRESVRRWGAFAAHGDDFSHHAQFVQLVIGRYAHLVETIEALALGFEPLRPADAVVNYLGASSEDIQSGASISGTPIGIQFARTIDNVPAFCEELFSSRAPFRLWGRPVLADDYALVEAVDLHVGERLSIEIGHDWMRVYLLAGSCGNTIARLISNLQTRFDGALSLTHPDLQQAAALEPAD